MKYNFNYKIMKKCLCYIIVSLFIFSTQGQDCPKRIGDFIVNETLSRSLNKNCNCETNYSSVIENAESFSTQYVFSDDIDESFTGSHNVFKLIPDTNNINSEFSIIFASFNPNVKSFFIPNYETDGISIKNLLLKFYNDTLYYIQASLSDDYQKILEKYSGKWTTRKKKETKTLCTNKKIQLNSANVYAELYIISKMDTSIIAQMIFDFGISKECNVYSNSVIQMFNIETYLKEMVETENYVKQIIKIKKEQFQTQNKRKLSRF